MCLGAAFTFVCGVRGEVSVGGEAFAVNRTYDGFRRASETAVVITNVRHAAQVRLYDPEDRVCGYALMNAAGRGVSVTLAYDGSYVTNTVYTMPDGGENLYSFCRNNAVGCCDSDGRIVITWPIINPSVPHSWSNLGNDNFPLREEAWFEGNYPGLIAEARRRFTQEIENGIDCSKDTVDGKSTRMNIDPGVAGDWPWSGCIGGNDTEFGDAGQSAWEAVAVLGKFSIDYVTPVNIHYSCEQGRRVYRWTTTMYVEDVMGLQGDEGWFGRYFGWAARSRRVKRAQWTLSGAGVCK